ncbi:alpha/beta fold hydrolase [Tabrizicola piscis]|uniref:Alpha/beta fold hydrolase n=1 Tax=Tabrizicola piscis TaxID=2494374 RepID=A0A3S8U5Z1_9RHOB|nr:alpha/beta fold hydrolase [Tabrizicola piscis]AZL59082.1 alpha/beta fold hydrolase [Tabrizicola piscis]
MRYVFGLLTILVFVVVIGLLGLRLTAMLREISILPDSIPEEGRIVETALGPIYVEELGPEDGPVVLLVHGSVGWSRMWRPTQVALAAEGYRTVAFDMPPMGYSFRDPDADYSRQTQGGRMLALIAALDVRPVVVAHSFGAGPAAEAAMVDPAAIAGLVVVSGAIGLEGREGGTLPWPLGNSFMRELAVSASVTNPYAMGPLLRLFLHRKEAATPEVIDMLLAPSRRPGTTTAIAGWLPSLLVPPTGALSTRAEGWQALAVPLAFLWGDRDTATPLAQGERLADLTGAPLSILPEVGHIPQIEAPDDFQAALIALLADLTPPITAP